eukprot:TRINITY_DN22327_c0_g2_i1.p1 TRINITY_DN22327_c0_g2~~TRINITY_DN22327_c0_g2_i1.p1  ORF type:complete len:331 (-),score=90.20 TRINITY_DN22327_c0_g2_i1:47-1039(-)
MSFPVLSCLLSFVVLVNSHRLLHRETLITDTSADSAPAVVKSKTAFVEHFALLFCSSAVKKETQSESALRKECKKCFSHLDSDHDGRISKEEFIDQYLKFKNTEEDKDKEVGAGPAAAAEAGDNAPGRDVGPGGAVAAEAAEIAAQDGADPCAGADVEGDALPLNGGDSLEAHAAAAAAQDVLGDDGAGGAGDALPLDGGADDSSLEAAAVAAAAGDVLGAGDGPGIDAEMQADEVAAEQDVFHDQSGAGGDPAQEADPGEAAPAAEDAQGSRGAQNMASGEVIQNVAEQIAAADEAEASIEGDDPDAAGINMDEGGKPGSGGKKPEDCD